SAEQLAGERTAPPVGEPQRMVTRPGETIGGGERPGEFVGPPEPLPAAPLHEAAVRRALRPDARMESEPGYVYHATNEDNAYGIGESGTLDTHEPWHGTDQNAWPDGSVEPRSYWTENAGTAWHFAPEEGRSVLLRTRHENVPGRESTGDSFSTDPVPADRLEIWTDRGWEPFTGDGAARAAADPGAPPSRTPPPEGPPDAEGGGEHGPYGR